MRQLVSRNFLTVTGQSIFKDISDHEVSVEITRSAKLWGLFSDESDSPRPSLGWPFTEAYNSMGMSMSVPSCPFSGTLGGYFKLTDKTSKDHILGLTCYHVVRKGPNNDVSVANETSDIQSTGLNTPDWPCQ